MGPAPRAAPQPLPESFIAGAYRLILAKRPETHIPGLDRAVVYGRAQVFDTEALLFTEEELATILPRRRAERIMVASGGWPLLLPFAENGRDAGRLEAVLAGEWMTTLAAAKFVTLGRVIDGETLAFPSAGALAPAIRRGSPAVLRAEALRATLARAHSTELARRIGVAEDTSALACALRAQGRTVEAIEALQAAGRFDAALTILIEEQSFFFSYRCGGEAFGRILAGFPPDHAQKHEVIVLGRCLQALSERHRRSLTSWVSALP